MSCSSEKLNANEMSISWFNDSCWSVNYVIDWMFQWNGNWKCRHSDDGGLFTNIEHLLNANNAHSCFALSYYSNETLECKRSYDVRTVFEFIRAKNFLFAKSIRKCKWIYLVMELLVASSRFEGQKSPKLFVFSSIIVRADFISDFDECVQWMKFKCSIFSFQTRFAR